MNISACQGPRFAKSREMKLAILDHHRHYYLSVNAVWHHSPIGKKLFLADVQIIFYCTPNKIVYQRSFTS